MAQSLEHTVPCDGKKLLPFQLRTSLFIQRSPGIHGKPQRHSPTWPAQLVGIKPGIVGRGRELVAFVPLFVNVTHKGQRIVESSPEQVAVLNHKANARRWEVVRGLEIC